MSDLPIDDTITEIAIGIHTAGQARAVLGECARLLRQGYDRLDEIPSSFWDSANARASAQSALDQANAYAQKIYAAMPVTGSFAIDDVLRSQTAAALKTTWRALRLIEVAAEAEYWDFGDAISSVLAGTGGAVGTVIAAPLAAVVKKTWWILLMIAAALFAWWWVRR